jgi:hypothetical protein
VPIYDFEFNNDAVPVKWTNQQFDPKNRHGLEQKPAIHQRVEDPRPRDDIFFERQNVNIAEEVHEILPQGHRTMDRGLKNYFSGIPVPTKDGVRIMGVRISGGDKPYLIWAQDLRYGRVTLPIMAIRRESDEFHFMKFSPAHHHYIAKRFIDQECSRIALTYRPVPSLINYTLSVWAEHKRDLEYVNYQVRRRFNPVAEFLVEDEHLRGSVFLKYNGTTMAIDDDIPAEQRQNKRYDYSITMEGWMPLPEKIVPSILGTVTSLREGRGVLSTPGIGVGDLLETVSGKSDLPLVQIRSRP